VIHEKVSLSRAYASDGRSNIGDRAIRTDTAGADGLPLGCEQTLRRAYRQAAADERVPAREQGQAFRIPAARLSKRAAAEPAYLYSRMSKSPRAKADWDNKR
jgi:hypothetical protein